MDNSFRSGNKENVLRASENIANISLGSFNCNLGFNQSKLNANDSYYDEDNRAADWQDNQLEVYEKKIKSLANENIALRKKNKNLIEVARLKEEELSSALEDAQKKKEKENEKLDSKLDNYYECFLQIENEKNCFKEKYEAVVLELDELKERFETFEAEVLEVKPDENEAEERIVIVEDEEVKKLSAEHVDNELKQAKKLADSVGAEKRRSMAVPLVIESIEDDSEKKIDYKVENANLKQQIEELEVEKGMLESKHASVEAALARWIFKACDNNTDLSKAKERAIELEKENEEIRQEMEQLRTDRDSSLKLFKLNQENLNDAKEILSEKNCELEKLSMRNTSLEVENHELSDKLEQLSKKILEDMWTQTEALTFHSVHSQTLEADAVQSTAKNVSSSNINAGNGIVANMAAKFNGGKTVTSPVISATSPVATNPGSDCIDMAGLHNELKSVKVKNDHLIMEKMSLKSRNEELKVENEELRTKLEELDRESAELATYITTSIEKSDQLLKKPPIETKSVGVETKPKTSVSSAAQHLAKTAPSLASGGTQTSRARLHETTKHTTQMTTQTSSTTVVSVQNTETLWKSRIEACRAEMNTEIAELTEQISVLKSKCDQLGADLEREQAKISKLNLLNKEISFNLSNKNEEYLQLEHAMKEQNDEFKKKKQIADTIIQQQKKLLDHIQSTGNNKNLPADPQAKKLKAKTNKKNPLLAHLSKPSVPYKFSHQTSAASSIASTTSTSTSDSTAVSKSSISTDSIEAELNSNYVAYETLNRIRRPPDMAPPPLKPEQQQQKEQATARQIVPKQELVNKNIHVFITGLNTFPVYCHVCQHLIPIIAYASKCQICSFTCHSQCSNLNKHANKSLTNGPTATGLNDDLFKYCQTNYMKTSMAYNNYVNKLIKTSGQSHETVRDKSQNYLLADYLHMYVDGKWKKFWVILRINGQIDLYQSHENRKAFDNMNLIGERVKFETDYTKIKKLLANYASQLSSTTTSSTATSPSSQAYKASDDNSVNLYEAVDQTSQPRTDFTTSLVILLYTQKTCTQLGFDTFSKKIIWLDALQSSCLISSNPMVGGIPASNSSGNISKKLALAAPSVNSQKFKSFNLERALNPFLELSDFLSVNSFCFINERLIALACDDGLYVSEPGAPSINGAPSLSLVKINTIESAHKLNHEYGKLCLIGRRSRQFLAIDINDLLTAKVIHKNVNDESSENNSDDEEDEKLINVKIEHIHSIDRCHLFESSLSATSNWYSAVATPETIYILLFNQTTSKFNLIKTINTQHDSPCLCLKFSQMTNQLIYGCTKEFNKMDLDYLQPAPIVENLVSTGKKILNDEDLLASSKKKQPISVCVIKLLDQADNEAVLLCYEDYALILNFNNSTQSWQLQQTQQALNSSKKNNSSTSICTSNSTNGNNVACLKWPRGLPPLQIEYDAPNLYLFYNDSIIVYKISFDEGLFMFKTCGIAWIYKPRFLSTLHLNNANCIIISNRRTSSPAAVSSKEGSESSRNIYSEFETENDYTDDMEDSSKFDDEDRICLSHFSPYDE